MDIVDKESLTVVGIPVRAGWKELWADMPEAWRELLGRRDEIEHRVGQVFVDVSLEKQGDEYLQLVGAQVSEVGRVPEGMWAVEIPAQRWLHHRHVGPLQEIAKSFGKMYAWAKENEIAVDEMKLDGGYTVTGGEKKHELLIRVLPGKPWRELGRG